jgi:hypothetical protein
VAGVGVADFLQNMTSDIILCSGEEKVELKGRNWKNAGINAKRCSEDIT